MPSRLGTKKVFEVYELNTSKLPEIQVDTIGTIDGDKITGPQADMVRRMLVKSGWPNVRPDVAISGSYVWACQVTKMTAGK